MRLFVIACTLSIVLSLTATATPPPLVSYQGRLTDSAGNPVKDSTYNVTFLLYSDPTALTPVWWQESRSVTTVDGLFSINLGSDFGLDYSTLQNFPYGYAFLGIKVGSEPELTPRTRLTSVFYAMDADHSNSTSSVNGATGGSILSSLTVNDSIISDLFITGMVKVNENAGESAQPEIGELWRDNNIVAWGEINSDGSIAASYGVDSVQHVSAGKYYVYPSASRTRTIPFAQSLSTVENPYVTTVFAHGNSFIEVGTYFLNSHTAQDGYFYIIVTGR